MKKLLCLFVCFFTASVFANWEEAWSQGVRYAENADYPAAEKAFSLAIANLQGSDHDSIYIDRAEIYNLQDNYTEALFDLNKALSSKHLSNEERLRGLFARITAHCNLKMEQQVLADFEAFKAAYPNFPTVEYTEDNFIIHNVPDCSCYKRLAKALLVASEICEKESDIHMLDGMCIAKRKIFNNKMIANSRRCSECVNDCKFWCDKCALIGIEWCVNVYKGYKCQKSCLCAVDLIRDKCNWCCRKGHSDKKCVRPFENIIYHMDRSCDPWCHDD